MLKYTHPTLAWLLDLWPITIFAPTVLLLIAILALITRWWDQRDQAAREAARTSAADPGVVVKWESGRRRKPPAPGASGPGRTVNGDHGARTAS